MRERSSRRLLDYVAQYRKNVAADTNNIVPGKIVHTATVDSVGWDALKSASKPRQTSEQRDAALVFIREFVINGLGLDGYAVVAQNPRNHHYSLAPNAGCELRMRKTWGRLLGGGIGINGARITIRRSPQSLSSPGSR